MRLGKNRIFVLITFYFLFSSNIYSEEKILSSPLINLENLEPTFENIENQTNEDGQDIIFKNKATQKFDEKFKFVEIIGLDKITAKTQKIKIKVGEKKKFWTTRSQSSKMWKN